MNECYSCEYRRALSGSAHSECKHPLLEGNITEDPMVKLLAIFASVGRVEPVALIGDATPLNIKANAHGIREGWFNFPFNYDPVWLENCDGYVAAGIRPVLSESINGKFRLEVVRKKDGNSKKNKNKKS